MESFIEYRLVFSGDEKFSFSVRALVTEIMNKTLLYTQRYTPNMTVQFSAHALKELMLKDCVNSSFLIQNFASALHLCSSILHEV